MNTTLLLISATVALVALVDYVPRLLLKAKKPTNVIRSRQRVPEFYILPTVYGDISYLKNISFLKKYAKRVIICTSTYETAEFYAELRKICRRYGFRYLRADVPKVNGRPIKNAYTIYKGIFAAKAKLKIKNSTPCVLIDADTYAEENIHNLIRTFIQSDYSIASLRCEAQKPQNVLQVLQEFEYKVAMDNRTIDPWLTSGACNIGTKKVYKRVFARHSEFFAGGDIEIGKLASVMGYKVGHIGFTFYTEVPKAFRDWYNQRITWFAGGIRHHVANISSFGWYHFFMLFYNSAIIYLLLPVRWVEFTNYPATLILLLGVSWFYTFVLLAGRSWRAEYFLLPFYSFFQTMWVVPRASFRYIRLAWEHRSPGFFNYDLTNKEIGTRIGFGLLNFASAVIVIIAAAGFTVNRIEYWRDNPRGYVNRAINLVSKN